MEAEHIVFEIAEHTAGQKEISAVVLIFAHPGQLALFTGAERKRDLAHVLLFSTSRAIRETGIACAENRPQHAIAGTHPPFPPWTQIITVAVRTRRLRQSDRF